MSKHNNKKQSLTTFYPRKNPKNNWCSSDVVHVPQHFLFFVSDINGEEDDDESQLFGYLEWLEHKKVEDLEEVSNVAGDNDDDYDDDDSCSRKSNLTLGFKKVERGRFVINGEEDDDESQLFGYLEWLEHKKVEDLEEVSNVAGDNDDDYDDDDSCSRKSNLTLGFKKVERGRFVINGEEDDDESQLFGYLEWLEHKKVEDLEEVSNVAGDNDDDYDDDDSCSRKSNLTLGFKKG
ncbi:hypothetical protein Bca4012_021638 [Brassica carinata]